MHDHRAANRRSLWIALALISVYALIEVVGGLLSNSLALLADAGHMVTDAAAILMALLAIWAASRPSSSSRTFGFHRTEILAAFLNALVLGCIAGWIFFEAARRFGEPPEVRGTLMLGVGFVGLLVNVAAARVLYRSAHGSLNVEGAFLHVLSDLLGSIGVVVAALLVLGFGWTLADPIFGIAIGTLIVLGSSRLLWKTLHVLMEGTPTSLDLDTLCQRFEQVEGVTGVHDIHAWTITTGYEVLSAHVTADADRHDAERLLEQLRALASKEFGISHVTIQLEESPERCAEAHHASHGDGQPSAS
ncbi:MAG: cation diffusion facilitator family transporter [Chloroflexi bacterium]|nr:cation diffusion facilitator family transporter [Chloroflexota bacterium]